MSSLQPDARVFFSAVALRKHYSDLRKKFSAAPREEPLALPASPAPRAFVRGPVLYAEQFGPVPYFQRVRAADVVKAAAEFYGIDLRDALSQSRSRSVVKARQVAMYIISTVCGRSYMETARAVYREDHTTAVYAVQKIGALIKTDAVLAAEVEEIKRNVGLGSAA